MNIVYEAHFYDIEFEHKGKKKTGEEFTKKIKVVASNLKSICLALADHANDEGEGAYPSIWKLESKTELSRVTVIACLKALKHQGIATYMGISKFDTCNYTINREILVEMASRERQKREKQPSKATSPSKAAIPAVVKPLSSDSKAALPEPSFNHHLTNTEGGKKTPPSEWGLTWQLAAGVKEVVLPDEDQAAQAKISNAVELFPQAYKELARAFILATGIFPIKSDVGGWCKAFRDQDVRTGLTPDDIAQACKQMFNDKLTIKDPFSVMGVAGNIHNESKRKVVAAENKTPNVVDTPFAKALEKPVSEETKKTLSDFGKVLRERAAAKKRQPD